MDQTLKRKEILRGKYIYRKIFAGGLSISGNAIRATVAPTSPIRHEKVAPNYLVGIAVHRSVKHAVDRNRIKRWIREAYRIHKSLLGVGTSKQGNPRAIIFTWRRHVNVPHNLSFSVIEEDVKNILKKITILQS